LLTLFSSEGMRLGFMTVQTQTWLWSALTSGLVWPDFFTKSLANKYLLYKFQP
jgi:hypothetical protein